jgi:hypothetical protein
MHASMGHELSPHHASLLVSIHGHWPEYRLETDGLNFVFICMYLRTYLNWIVIRSPTLQTYKQPC